jgi:hypothetical protein
MARAGHNTRYDADVAALVAKLHAARDKAQIPDRQHASGAKMPDGCWSCVHYSNQGGNVRGTPPWPTCALSLEHPECGRWELSEQPWRYDFEWRSAGQDPNHD